MKFKTSDGYTLHQQGTTWVDSLDPETLDMTFPQYIDNSEDAFRS